MLFEELLGNQRIKENLQTSVSRGRISHCYLITGPEGSGKHTLARLLSAAIMCRSDNKPCMTCPACRKVMADTHPDVITVDDPGKKTVPVDLIRETIADMFIRPNEADKKIYCIPRAVDMGISGQNALLKILEEPPAYGVFILLADNPEKLLTTIRSRCIELSLQSLPDGISAEALRKEFPQAGEGEIAGAIQRSGGYLGQAKQALEAGEAIGKETRDFVKSFSQRDALLLVKTLAPMEKMPRDQLITALEQWKAILHQALICRSGMQPQSEMAETVGACRSATEIRTAIRHLDKGEEYARGNVSPGAICGYLAWALR